jgi:hypothetical protein
VTQAWQQQQQPIVEGQEDVAVKARKSAWQCSCDVLCCCELQVWDSFMNAIEPIASRVPYMVRSSSRPSVSTPDGDVLHDASCALQLQPYRVDPGKEVVYLIQVLMASMHAPAACPPFPSQVGVGNHEYDFTGSSERDPSGVSAPYHPPWGNYGDESGGECGAMTARRFAMPSSRWGLSMGGAHSCYCSYSCWDDLSSGHIQAPY